MTSNFDRWYAKNRETHNVKRREKYEQDKQYRQEIVQRQREYRVKQRSLRALEPQPAKSDDSLMTVTEVAQVVARSPITVRAWEKRGLIPKPQRDATGARRYTQKQCRQICRLAQFIDKTFEYRTQYIQKLPQVIESISNNW